MNRIACLFVPLFPLAARLRSEPELAAEAVVIVEGNGHASYVAAATRRARKAGIRRGMTLPQARALIPKAILRPRDSECERAAKESLLEVVESFSPRVESGDDGYAYLDLEGLERHFTGEKEPPERALGEALRLNADRAGLAAWVGIASSKLAARVAAECPDSPTVVAAGREADFLAPLSLHRLAPEAETLDLLRQWGIRSIGDFARLPKHQIASRLGSSGQRLHEMARGLDRHPIVPYVPSPTFHEGMDLDWPLVQLEPFLFVARAALDRICQRLENRGLGCIRLELTMRLEPEGHHARSIQLPAPTRDPKTLLTLARLDLERHPPGAPVNGFAITAHPDRPRGAQLSLFGPTALSPDRLATTLARLFTLLGGKRIGSPQTVNGHRPERCSLVDFLPPPVPDVRPEPPASRGLLAARVIRPAIPLEVLTAERGYGDAVAEPDPTYETTAAQPVEIQSTPPQSDPDSESGVSGKRGVPVKQPEVRGRVCIASGPWTLEEGWWTGDATERSYWDVELSDGAIYRIYRDTRNNDWYADGIYD